MSDSNIDGSMVPPGALINLLQKGVQYTEAELCIHDVSRLLSLKYFDIEFCRKMQADYN